MEPPKETRQEDPRTKRMKGPAQKNKNWKPY
jgi:hypothetical protein